MNIYYDSSEIISEGSSEKELNKHIGNTNYNTCSNCSKMEHQQNVFVVLKYLKSLTRGFLIGIFLMLAHIKMFE